MAELKVFSTSEDDLVALRARGLLPEPWSASDPWPDTMTAESDTLRSRYRGCLVGGAIGDALGRPGEARRPEVTAARYGELRDFHPWRGWTSGPRGTITDDTQLTMEVAQTYLDCGCFDPSDFARRVGEWLDYGRGKGRACTQAALRIRAGEPWTTSGVASAGNGAAMRAAPIGLARAHDFNALRLDAALSAIPTHADGMAVASACAVAFAVAYLLRVPVGALDPSSFVAAVVRSLDGIPDPGHPERRLGAGRLNVRLSERIAEIPDFLDVSWQEAMQRTWNGAFVLESLPAAFWFFLAYRDDPEEAIVRAASAGFDCDTVASMTGNLIGAYHGLEALPERWREDVEYYDELIGLADGLLELAEWGTSD